MSAHYFPRRLLDGAPAAAALAAALLAPTAPAAVYTNGSVGNSFELTLQIMANCVITAAPLDFGQSRGAVAANLAVNTTISVTCSDSTPYNVGLDAGSGSGSSTVARYLSGSAGGNVAYNLYQSNGSTNWGNTPGTDTLGGTGNGSTQRLTVVGRIPAQSIPAADVYKAIITATVYF